MNKESLLEIWNMAIMFSSRPKSNEEVRDNIIVQAQLISKIESLINEIETKEKEECKDNEK